MMAMNKGITVEFHPGIKQVSSRISSLPDVYLDEVLEAVGEYGLGVLRDYDPKYKYVSRAEAYPDADYMPGYFSEAQFKFVMAAIASGDIVTPYRRTGEMAESWKITKKDDRSFAFHNPTEAAIWTMGEQQSRHEKLVGWKKAVDFMLGALTFRSSKFRHAVEVAYQKAIRKLEFE